MDRLVALLVLMLFALETATLALLLLDRIDPAQYGALKVASLGLVFGLVMRWRSESGQGAGRLVETSRAP